MSLVKYPHSITWQFSIHSFLLFILYLFITFYLEPNLPGNTKIKKLAKHLKLSCTKKIHKEQKKNVLIALYGPAFHGRKHGCTL